MKEWTLLGQTYSLNSDRATEMSETNRVDGEETAWMEQRAYVWHNP